LALVVAVFLGGAAAPVARGAKVVLLGDVEVHADSVFLSDLLPAQVPSGVRTPAQNILIGSAPLPGTARVFDGAKVAGVLGSDIASEMSIPPQIVVRRTGRTITREEVVAVIRAALNQNGLSNSDLQPDDLRVFPSVMASSAHAELQVRRMDFDSGLNEARFLMAEPDALPFLVTARLRTNISTPGASQISPGHATLRGDVRSEFPNAQSASVSPQHSLEELVGLRSLQRAPLGGVLNAARAGGVTLVEPGKPAVLHLFSSGIRMSLDVTPLERGALNQTIRVRFPGTGKVLQAQVTGVRQLEATF
jgi:flagella basal body P-ring formation protein FlgA